MASTKRITDVAAHFWSKVQKSDGDGCWLWLGRTNERRGGYGLFDVHRVTKRAHRFAYELEHGPVADDVEICHRCDNPCCVRPDHLFEGTRKDNAADCVAKGRSNRGERHGIAKLTDADVVEIRRLRDAGVTVRAIAHQFGVDPMTVSLIGRRLRWRHVLDHAAPSSPSSATT